MHWSSGVSLHSMHVLTTPPWTAAVVQVLEASEPSISGAGGMHATNPLRIRL